ncbi:MAG: hypothetical protein Q9159_000908 [Coniocarpon cinnabarinum]
MKFPTKAEVVAAGLVFPLVDTVIVALRLLTKIRLFEKMALRTKRFTVDDYLIVFSLVSRRAHETTDSTNLPDYIQILTYGLSALTVAGAFQGGLGAQPPPHQSVVNESEGLKNGAAKLSVLFFYRQIFGGRPFNILSWTMIALTVSWMLTAFFLNLFQCGSHLSAQRSPNNAIKDRYCIDGFKITIPMTVLDVLLDLIILIMPLYWVSSASWTWSGVHNR